MDEDLMQTDDIDVLRDKCQFWRNEAGAKQIHINEALDSLHEKEIELQKQSDLCTMYEHILDTRSAELDQMTNNFAADETRITALEQTIDVLAARIAKLKEND